MVRSGFPRSSTSLATKLPAAKSNPWIGCIGAIDAAARVRPGQRHRTIEHALLWAQPMDLPMPTPPTGKTLAFRGRKRSEAMNEAEILVRCGPSRHQRRDRRRPSVAERLPAVHCRSESRSGNDVDPAAPAGMTLSKSHRDARPPPLLTLAHRLAGIPGSGVSTSRLRPGSFAGWPRRPTPHRSLYREGS